MAGYDNYTTVGCNDWTSTNVQVWNGWVNGTVTTASTIWPIWTSGTASTYNPGGTVGRLQFGYTDGLGEYLVAAAARATPRGAIHSRQEFLTQRERRKASEKGLDLLRFLLSTEQLRELRGYGSVRVLGSAGSLYEFGLAIPEVAYRIDREGKADLKLGICQTGKNYCAEDRVAAAILAFQADEALALRVAVRHTLHEREPLRVQKRRVFRKRAA